MEATMKRKRLLMLMAVVMLVGCGSTDTTDNTRETETLQTEETEQIEQTQQTQPQEETHTHVYTESITAEASCETDGVKTYTCECGDSYTEAITATGHIYENYVSNNDATYTADGTETATCVCGLTDTRTAEGSKLEYTYTDLDKTMYAKQTVNVRDLPSTDGNKLGGLSSAQEVKVTGQCNETSWYKIVFDGEVAFVSDSYLAEEKPVQQAAQVEQDSQTSSGTGNTYILEGTDYKLEYGVMYLNVCGHNLTGERTLSRSQGHFPYPLGQLIDNGDGTYTVYTLASHGYFLDGQFYIHDTSATSNVWHSLEQQGYTVGYVGGDTWHACVGGYDEGCIHALIVY